MESIQCIRQKSVVSKIQQSQCPSAVQINVHRVSQATLMPTIPKSYPGRGRSHSDQALFRGHFEDAAHLQAGPCHLLLAGAVGPLRLPPLPCSEHHENKADNHEQQAAADHRHSYHHHGDCVCLLLFISLAALSHIAGTAATLVIVDQVSAGATVEAGVGDALVYISFTALSSEASPAGTFSSPDAIFTVSIVLTPNLLPTLQWRVGPLA